MVEPVGTARPPARVPRRAALTPPALAGDRLRTEAKLYSIRAIKVL